MEKVVEGTSSAYLPRVEEKVRVRKSELRRDQNQGENQSRASRRMV